MRLWLKRKKIHHLLEFNQTKWLKQYIKFNTQKRIEAEINKDKDGKAFCKLMNNAIYRIIMEKLRNRIQVKLVNNEKDWLKFVPKPSYI